jgi:hypothetical protein
MKRLWIAVIGAFSLANVHAQNADSADAAALVRAMRTDVMLLTASKEALSRAASEGYYTKAQLQCFLKLPASAFTGGLAKILARILTPDEITEALAFYGSPLGTKFVEYSFTTMNREKGTSFPTSPVGSQSPMTADEMKRILEFSRTDLGRKVMDKNSILGSPEADATAKRVVARQLTACGAKIPG